MHRRDVIANDSGKASNSCKVKWSTNESFESKKILLKQTMFSHQGDSILKVYIVKINRHFEWILNNLKTQCTKH